MEKISEVVIAENDQHIHIAIIAKSEDDIISWEEIQHIKDLHYSNLDFIEIYPKSDEIVNKANVRHIIHVKGWICPKLWDLEKESSIIVVSE